MTDQKKPEVIADDDLDVAAGGSKHEFRENVSFSFGPIGGIAKASHPRNELSSPGDAADVDA